MLFCFVSFVVVVGFVGGVLGFFSFYLFYDFFGFPLGNCIVLLLLFFCFLNFYLFYGFFGCLSSNSLTKNGLGRVDNPFVPFNVVSVDTELKNIRYDLSRLLLKAKLLEKNIITCFSQLSFSIRFFFLSRKTNQYITYFHDA